jgi:UDP-glucose 4-epimerase
MVKGACILIAGGGGFIGSNAARALIDRGHRVKLVGRSLLPQNCIEGAEYLQLDLLGAPVDHPYFSDVTAIVHAASTTIPSTSTQDMTFDITSNATLALRLLNISVYIKADRFIFLSSGGTVYGVPKSLPVAEDHATEPISSYGITKLAIEKYLQLYARTRRLAAFSLRVANPYGPEQLIGTPVGAISNFIRCVRSGRPIQVWGDGSIVRDYIHIDDVSSAIRACLDTPNMPAGAYNVGSGLGTSLNELIDLVKAKHSEPIEVNYEQARDIDVDRIVLDSSRLTAATGWRPTRRLLDGVDELWKAALKADGEPEIL